MVKPIYHYSVPHLVHIETTYNCNSNCIFCYNPHRNSVLNYKNLDRIVESIKNSNIPHVYLIGGEPSLLKLDKLNQYINSLSQTSSVTIVTNGLIYLKGLSKNLACIGIPLHGNKKTQEYLTGVKGGYDKIIANIKKYIQDGFEVRCIPVLMSVNYDQMYEVIKVAANLGMESVFVDRFESGGLGSKLAKKLSPSLNQFKIALSQMIKARNDFGIPTGFGTAIPYCLDKRLIVEGMGADCGVGVTFAAINPQGDLRVCNQSQIIYGNVLKEPIEKIWNKKSLNGFRDLKWVSEPCKDCNLLYECVCGCKVDTNCPGEFCIDYAIRGHKKPLNNVKRKTNINSITYPKLYRRFKKDNYLKLNDSHKESYIITRYQTVEIDTITKKVIRYILNKEGSILEKDLVDKFKKEASINELRKLLSKLELVGAIKEYETLN